MAQSLYAIHKTSHVSLPNINDYIFATDILKVPTSENANSYLLVVQNYFTKKLDAIYVTIMLAALGVSTHQRYL